MGAIQDNLDKVRVPVEVSCKWCGQSKPEHTQWPVRSNYYQCKGELAPWVGCCFEPKPVETFCIDCGQPTTPGKGSARCPGCWSDRLDYVRDAIITDQTTGSGDYSEAEDYANRITGEPLGTCDTFGHSGDRHPKNNFCENWLP